MTGLGRAGWLVLVASTVSCGLVFSLDGYEGPADASTDATSQDGTSAVHDAGSEPFDGGTTDSASPPPDGPGVDGSGEDAGVVDAPSTDAFDAGNPQACPGHPTAIFCDDFDQGTFGAKWNASPESLQTTLSLSDAQASSPPSSMYVSVWADASVPEAVGYLADEIDGSAPSTLRVSFDFFVDAIALRSAQVSIVGLTDGINVDTFYLRINGAGGNVNVFQVGQDLADGGEQSYPIDASDSIEPFGQWVRAILMLNLGSTPTYQLTLERPPGALAAPITPSVPVILDVSPARVLALAGLEALVFSTGQPSTCSFYVDNVVVESE
jgi:hypothetical protein